VDDDDDDATIVAAIDKTRDAIRSQQSLGAIEQRKKPQSTSPLAVLSRQPVVVVVDIGAMPSPGTSRSPDGARVRFVARRSFNATHG
jgi:hypothetical protein